MLNVPRPKVTELPVTDSTIESAMIPTLPIVILNAFFVTSTFTLFSGPAEDMGNHDIASNPKLIKIP